VRAELLNRLSPIRGFRNQTHVRLRCQQSGYSVSEEGMIVDR
jgi:hypothetical protein